MPSRSTSDRSSRGPAQSPEAAAAPAASHTPAAPTAADLAVLQAQIRELSQQLDHQERLATLGTIAGLIAHEFNNILTPVLTYAQMAQLDPGNAALSQKAIDRTVEGVERASSIAQVILGFVRDERTDLSTPARSLLLDASGGSTWNTVTSANVAKAVRSALACLGRAPERDNITATFDLPEHLTAAIAPVSLQHVVLNLVLNARNAMLPRPGRLTISARAHTHAHPPVVPDDALDSRTCSTWNTGAAGSVGVGSTNATPATAGTPASTTAARAGWVELIIQDTGKGMTLAQLKRLFTPFATSSANQPADDAASVTATEPPRSRGTGLGMTICKRLVEQAGGYLAVRSTPGQGTAVHVVVPMPPAGS